MCYDHSMNLEPRPLVPSQVDAATALLARCPGLQLTRKTIRRMHAQMPGFDEQACLAKTAVVNSLYSTGVLDVWGVARHVQGILTRADVGKAGPELVDPMAAVPGPDGKIVPRRFTSFASKFAHFFIDSERFPILDSYVEQRMAWHRGCGLRAEPGRRYQEFWCAFMSLKDSSGLESRGNEELDGYLWLSGQIASAQDKPEVRIGLEVRALMESMDEEVKRLLHQLRGGMGSGGSDG